ncbi:pseudouridine synthase, partial [Ramicandelaber brevisporus]
VRRVIPYHYTFKTFVKRRWLGRTLIDVLDSEFRDQTHDYYVKAIEDGRIRLNDKLAATSTVIVDGYVLSHTTHRHEPPVTAQPITIVEHTDEGLLVIDKPASIPVHPTGRYQHNSVIHILAKERGLGVSESDSNKVLLYPVNRLDRLTSGLMLIGSNVDVARRFERQMSERSIRKEYVCRVFGEFPKNMPFHQKVMPIRTINHKLGLNAVDLIEGKPCVTRFKLLSYDGTTSVVRAYPLTGRTHQIRVHLQFLGHPIANDPLYAHVSNVNKTTDETTPSETQDSNEGEEDDVSIRGGTVCKECGVIVPDDYRPEQMCIWLHAIKYSGEGWSYETTEPEWA